MHMSHTPERICPNEMSLLGKLRGKKVVDMVQIMYNK